MSIRRAAWAAGFAVLAASWASARDLVVIPQSAQPVLIHKQVPVTFKASAFFLAEWGEAEQLAAIASEIPFEVIRPDIDDTNTFYLFELHPGEDPPATWLPLYRNGLNVIVEMNDDEAERWTQKGQHAVRLFHTPHGWGSAATSIAYDCAPKPMISEMLTKTTPSLWTDWIEKLSGVEPVEIGGTPYTVTTRFTSSNFSGATNAKGFDFIKQQAQAWGFAGARLEEDPFTLGPGGRNLILTIPGTATGSNSEVLLTAHFDSIWQFGDSVTTAPGANDNGTGVATVLEAARLLRQYRFDRTIRLIFWTGEEQGLFGSAAYTQDHPMTNIAGVLNLDMFGYDLNGDRCFEIHAGTLPSSIDIGNCFAASISSYGTALSRDFLTTGATNRSDHASFWAVSVGAIEIAENFFNDGQPGGCVGQEPNPGYHTNADTLAGNMHPSYAHSIAKTALATIAAMAIPTQSCFGTTAPSIGATAGTNQVELTWAAVPGASSYRVYRSGDGCGGSFVSTGTTASTTFVDTVTRPDTYSYKVEAVTADGLCFSPESNCVGATPTVYHATPTATSFTDVCATGGPGSGNGVVEPGESVVMQVTLQNDSNTALTSLAGTFSSPSPGVTVTDGAAAWPDLAGFASAATLPDHFGFHVGPSVTCGAKLNLQVQASALQGGGWAAQYLKLVGAPGQTSGSFPSADVPKPILDLQTAISNTTITGAGNIVDVDVRVTLTHTWNSDVDMVLRHPDGTVVTLSTDNGSDGDNYTNTLFDDEAATPITGGVSPFTGSYRPETALSALDGKPAAGTWKLEVFDDANQDTGTLSSWSLELTMTGTPICNPCAAPPAPGEPAALLLGKSGPDLVLTWSAPACAPPGYGVFRGDLAALASTGVYGHDTALQCGGAATSYQLPIDDPQIGDAAYFLVVAAEGSAEGSYGTSSAAVERPVSAAACQAAQNLAGCP